MALHAWQRRTPTRFAFDERVCLACGLILRRRETGQNGALTSYVTLADEGIERLATKVGPCPGAPPAVAA